jgi:DNA-binding CsgD family transcriptional regulator
MKIISSDKLPHGPGLYDPGGCRRVYLFCERGTGEAHCQVREDPDKRFPREEASCVLTMNCMARGRLPEDYFVLVQAADDELKGLVERTEELLLARFSLESPVERTRREQEVLAGVVRTLENKEIAASLNVCVRTVKFHVSSLPSKFHVCNRMQLVREVTRASLRIFRRARVFRTARSADQGPVDQRVSLGETLWEAGVTRVARPGETGSPKSTNHKRQGTTPTRYYF